MPRFVLRPLGSECMLMFRYDCGNFRSFHSVSAHRAFLMLTACNANLRLSIGYPIACGVRCKTALFGSMNASCRVPMPRFVLRPLGSECMLMFRYDCGNFRSFHSVSAHRAFLMLTACNANLRLSIGYPIACGVRCKTALFGSMNASCRVPMPRFVLRPSCGEAVPCCRYLQIVRCLFNAVYKVLITYRAMVVGKFSVRRTSLIHLRYRSKRMFGISAVFFSARSAYRQLFAGGRTARMNVQYRFIACVQIHARLGCVIRNKVRIGRYIVPIGIRRIIRARKRSTITLRQAYTYFTAVFKCADAYLLF